MIRKVTERNYEVYSWMFHVQCHDTIYAGYLLKGKLIFEVCFSVILALVYHMRII
jgi:hypothetical protein